jgi:hypothetical protein
VIFSVTVGTGFALFLLAPLFALGAAPPSSPFCAQFENALQRAGVTISGTLQARLAAEYGAVFVAHADGIVLPSTVLFTSPDELEAFWRLVRPARLTVGSTRIELQSPAARALERVVAEARPRGLRLTVRGGPSAARRSYGESLSFWKQRVDNGLAHWRSKGLLTAKRADGIRRLPIPEQARAVLDEEAKGAHFSTSLDRTILRSVALPGSSQHHTMLALDVSQHDDPRVRALLARHGWFQTVIDDLPHFTFLGIPQDRLEAAGLSPIAAGGRCYWVPARRR